MHANAILSCTVLLFAASALGADSFHVIAPDSSGQRLLIVSVDVKASEVEIRQEKPLVLPLNPTSIVQHQGGTRLLVTTSQESEGGGYPAAEVEVNSDGKLRLLGTARLAGPTGYTSLDRSGRFLLTTHYQSGSVDVYRLNRNGRIAELVCHQQTPLTYAHSILTTPDNRFAYVPCVKENNALYQYSFDERTGQLRPLEPFDATPPAMFGPRHIAYHPDLPIAYFSNEQQLGVSVFEIGDDGQLADVQHAVSMPRRSPYERGQRGLHASDLVVSPDSKLLFLAVRDFVADEDSVFTFRIEADGRLSQIARTKVGDIPWKLDLSPDGKFLVVSEASNRSLAILKIQPDGSLSPAARIDWDAAVRDMVVIQSRS